MAIEPKSKSTDGATSTLVSNHLVSSQGFVTAAADSDLTGETPATWTDYTPTVKQSGTLNSVTVTRARYRQIGKMVWFVAFVVVANATGAVAGNTVEFALPVNASAAAHANIDVIGVGSLFDSSANLVYRGNAYLSSTTGYALFQPTNDTAVGFLGQIQFTAALAVNDNIRIQGVYEAA